MLQPPMVPVVVAVVAGVAPVAAVDFAAFLRALFEKQAMMPSGWGLLSRPQAATTNSGCRVPLVPIQRSSSHLCCFPEPRRLRRWLRPQPPECHEGVTRWQRRSVHRTLGMGACRWESHPPDRPLRRPDGLTPAGPPGWRRQSPSSWDQGLLHCRPLQPHPAYELPVERALHCPVTLTRLSLDLSPGDPSGGARGSQGGRSHHYHQRSTLG